MSTNNGRGRLIELRENEKEILNMALSTKDVLVEEFGVSLNWHEAIPTIAYVFLKEAIKHLNDVKEPGTEVSINLFQLLELGITFDDCDETEKGNNYTPFVTPGQEFKLLIKKDSTDDEE